MNLKELYQEIILEHGKNPRNLGKTEGFNKDAKVIILYVVIMFMFI
jgi:nitrogen fixation NifU-like protein